MVCSVLGKKICGTGGKPLLVLFAQSLSSFLPCLLKPLLNLEVAVRFCHPAVFSAFPGWESCRESGSGSCARTEQLLRTAEGLLSILSPTKPVLLEHLFQFLLPLTPANGWSEPAQTNQMFKCSFTLFFFFVLFLSPHFAFRSDRDSFRLGVFKSIHGSTRSTSRQPLFVHISRSSRKKSSIFQKFLPLPLPCVCL